SAFADRAAANGGDRNTDGLGRPAKAGLGAGAEGRVVSVGNRLGGRVCIRSARGAVSGEAALRGWPDGPCYLSCRDGGARICCIDCLPRARFSRFQSRSTGSLEV